MEYGADYNAIVDRLEGAGENLRAHGVELVALFTRNDFID